MRWIQLLLEMDHDLHTWQIINLYEINSIITRDWLLHIHDIIINLYEINSIINRDWLRFTYIA